jgi:glucokinase
MGFHQMTNDRITIGIDIGGTRTKAVALDADGTIVRKQVVPSHDDVESLLRSVGELLEQLSTPGQAVGISAPGIVARDNRAISWMRGRMQAVEGLNWMERLGRDVWVLNDAHAAAIGEAWIGAARAKSHVVVLTLGTGVGGGVILDGCLYQGSTGRAGHLGHTTVDADGFPDIVRMPGSLEDCIGNHNVHGRSGGRFSSTDELVRAVKDGDTFAIECWRESVRGLAVAVAGFINAFDPEVVVIGGGISECGPCLFDPLGEFLDEVEWRPTGDRVPIVPAELGEFAGAIGAARFASPPGQETQL